MMERYKGWWITGSGAPGPPYSSWCWYPKGSVLKDGRLGSVIEIGRIEDNGITFDIKALAVWYGMELSRIAVDECLTPE
jgi:hypothetical protein